jgi:hypothetical protein
VGRSISSCEFHKSKNHTLALTVSSAHGSVPSKYYAP